MQSPPSSPLNSPAPLTRPTAWRLNAPILESPRGQSTTPYLHHPIVLACLLLAFPVIAFPSVSAQEVSDELRKRRTSDVRPDGAFPAVPPRRSPAAIRGEETYPTSDGPVPKDPAPQAPPPRDRRNDSLRPDDDVPAASEEQIADWVDRLGSRVFAVRERAASSLTSLGNSILPKLREVGEQHDDPEVRIRANEIVKQLTRDDLAVRIDAFLSGNEIRFEGWIVTQAILGDSNRVRELFVAMLKSHPELVASLDGTARDRAMALKKVVSAVEKKMFIDFQMPDAADAIALLMPSIDPNVPLEGAYEDVLISVLRKAAVSDLHRDPQLGGPFGALLGRWIPRCSDKYREDVLHYGLTWDISKTHSLALRTIADAQALQAAADPQPSDALVLSMQAIARFGNERDVEAVSAWLDDHRPIARRGFANGDQMVTELGDVAMATIARLKDEPLTKIGFTKDSFSAKFGFIPEDLAFPSDDKEARKAARAKIDRLLNSEDPEGL